MYEIRVGRSAGLSDVRRPPGGVTTEYTAEELIAKWNEFFEIHGYDTKIMELADLYPEKRSLEVQFEDLNRYDTDLGLYLLRKPNNALLAGEQAIRGMLPAADPKPRPHLRILGLPSDQHVPIRDLRAKHLGRFLAVQGLVRKATEVRPKVTDAMFRCLRCGTVLKEEQEGEQFREPLECYGDQGGCKRSASATKFVLVGEESLYLDTQKLEMQEAPEGLRGGEEPQRLEAWTEDDLAGITNPGARVLLNGVLRITQRSRQGAKSTLFDKFLEVHSVEYTEKEYEEVEITPADVAAIREAAARPGVVERIRRSIAPSLGGLEKEKEALALQLFSGLPKSMPDGRRIRGDIHILLVGDPGIGKCVVGDTEVLLPDGTLRPIRELVQQGLDAGATGCVDDGVYAKINQEVLTLGLTGKITSARATLAWRREAPPTLRRVTTRSGRSIVVTATHPFFVWRDGGLVAVEAGRLAAGEFIASPRELPVEGEPQRLDRIPYRLSRANNRVALKLPPKTTPAFWRYIGLVVGDGYVRLTDEGGHVAFTNNDRGLIEEVRRTSRGLGMNPSLYRSHPGKSSMDLVTPGVELATFLQGLGLAVPSKEKSVPPLLFRCTTEEVAAFLSGLFDAEGSVATKTNTIEISSASRRLLAQAQHLLLRLGIYGRIEEKPVQGVAYFRLLINAKDAVRFAKILPSRQRDKVRRLAALAARASRADLYDYVPVTAIALARIRKRLGLTQREMGVPRSSYLHYEHDRVPIRATLERIVRAMERRASTLKLELQDLRAIRQLLDSDVRWERITAISEEEATDPYVYDLQVPGTHNFLSNDFITHNSELLMYMRGLAPRAVFAVGGATTAAGLIAAAVHDEFGEGRWTLEAGALVLADKGLALIDEIDKMSEQDRSSIHAAMEQQRVSIAKAGITATLPTRCAILAAANPKFGRFAPGKAVSEQIAMAPTLLSRFDAIFTIHDEPDPLQDSALADHILRGHLLGAQRAAHEATPSVMVDPALEAAYKPEFEPEFLRKYVAYARRTYPVMTPDASEVIKGKYLEIRRGGAETGSVPITPRQLEAFIRLSEASARARLSPLVMAEDARRAVNIVEYWLRKVAGDEGGVLDIDRVVTGISSSQREDMMLLRDIITDLGQDRDGADEEEIVRRAAERGIPKERVRAILERWDREGEIYSPQRGKYRLISRL